MLDENRKLVLAIDFNNLAFASSFGNPLVNSHGEDVSMIKAYITKLRLLKDNFDPDYIVFANDINRSKTFRRQLYAEYKAQRKPHDQSLMKQMTICSQFTSLLGFQMHGHEKYEADDILGMISRFSNDNGMDCMIVTSDRDFYQLVNDHTYIVSPRNSDIIDLDYINDKYRLTPDQFIELKMLQGDPSDNIKGIPGIGEKTALSLLQDYGSIKSIYENINNIKPKIGKKLKDGESSLPLLRTLVTIVTDYKIIDFKIDDLYRYEPIQSEIDELILKHEIPSLTDVIRYGLMPKYNDKIEIHEGGV